MPLRNHDRVITPDLKARKVASSVESCRARALTSLRREAQRSVQADDFAVEVIVFDDALDHCSVLVRPPKAFRERDLRSPVRIQLLYWNIAVRACGDHAGRNGGDTNAERR